MLPAASWIVAVSTRVAPEVRLVRRAAQRDLSGGAVDDGEGAEGAGACRPPASRLPCVTERDERPPVRVLVGDAAGGRRRCRVP